MPNGEEGISREAFVRAWSTGSSHEQGDMLFSLLSDNVIQRLCRVEHQQQRIERRWAYIAGGLAILAVAAGPVATIIGNMI